MLYWTSSEKVMQMAAQSSKRIISVIKSDLDLILHQDTHDLDGHRQSWDTHVRCGAQMLYLTMLTLMAPDMIQKLLTWLKILKKFIPDNGNCS